MRHLCHRLTHRTLRLCLAILGAALVLCAASQTLAPRVLSASAGSPRHAVAAPVAFSPVAHRPAGAGTIVHNGQAPLAAILYHVENHWYEVKNGATIIVYAGAERQNPAQGMVVVEIASAGYTHVAGPFIYRTPTRAGSVHVASASGEQLTLAAANGSSVVFDVPSASFMAK